MADAFYVPLGDDVYRSTEHTVGPWSPDSQHMGPPSALLARRLERSAPAPDAVFARITVEILGPVPVADLSVREWLERPGRTVALSGAELAAGGRPVVRAWAWWLGATDTTDVVAGVPEALPPPDSGEPLRRPDDWRGGYLDAMEWVSVRGRFGADGPATLWARQRVLTVDGEEPTPLQRLLAVADSGNGAASRLDIRKWLFINTELTVHVWRPPVGEWMALDADSTLGPTGVGVARTTLFDPIGAVGFGMQSLLVRPR